MFKICIIIALNSHLVRFSYGRKPRKIGENPRASSETDDDLFPSQATCVHHRIVGLELSVVGWVSAVALPTACTIMQYRIISYYC